MKLSIVTINIDFSKCLKESYWLFFLINISPSNIFPNYAQAYKKKYVCFL